MEGDDLQKISYADVNRLDLLSSIVAAGGPLRTGPSWGLYIWRLSQPDHGDQADREDRTRANDANLYFYAGVPRRITS